jgi:hypothetical protein
MHCYATGSRRRRLGSRRLDCRRRIGAEEEGVGERSTLTAHDATWERERRAAASARVVDNHRRRGRRHCNRRHRRRRCCSHGCSALILRNICGLGHYACNARDEERRCNRQRHGAHVDSKLVPAAAEDVAGVRATVKSSIERVERGAQRGAAPRSNARRMQQR